MELFYSHLDFSENGLLRIAQNYEKKKWMQPPQPPKRSQLIRSMRVHAK